MRHVRLSHTPTWTIALIALCTFFTSFGQLFFKLGLNNLILSVTGLLTNYWLIFGFILYGIGAVILIISLKYGELSILYPIVALSFIWVNILSSIFLGDTMNPLKWLGVGAILVGVSFIGRGC